MEYVVFVMPPPSVISQFRIKGHCPLHPKYWFDRERQSQQQAIRLVLLRPFYEQFVFCPVKNKTSNFIDYSH